MYTIKNNKFTINFDSNSGGLISLSHNFSHNNMNWIEGDNLWGIPVLLPFFNILIPFNNADKYKFNTLSVKFKNETLIAIYEFKNISVTAYRYFDNDGYYCEKYILENTTKNNIYLKKGQLGILTPFNDDYVSSDLSLKSRCHTHLWCKDSCSYINAVHMSACPPHLGFYLTEGSLEGYSVLRNTANGSIDRGDFILNLPSLILKAKENLSFSWKFFFYEENFFKALANIKESLYVQADKYTLFPQEEITISAYYSGNIETYSSWYDDTKLKCTIDNNIIKINFIPPFKGSKTIYVQVNKKITTLNILVTSNLKNILDKRVHFIEKYQQNKDSSSNLFGAYLIYDNEDKSQYYDSLRSDHNCGRERVAMGTIMALYLQNNKEIKLQNSLNTYLNFIKRELFDETTGTVYNECHRNNTWHRKYNYPWMSTLFLEVYKLTNDLKYLKHSFSILKKYYENDGAHFYAIGIEMCQIISLLKTEKLFQEADILLEHFKTHGDIIIENSVHYPAHEVNYEQSIVAPAVSYLCQLYELTKDYKYLKEINKQLPLLEAFSFFQPDYHLNGIAIRHWDDYWFGKKRLYGDTFPHYWSVLTADAFMQYYKISNIASYKTKAISILRNNLCLFNEDGSASCAYVYPNNINGIIGDFFDPWANDQDYALYYAYKYLA